MATLVASHRPRLLAVSGGWAILARNRLSVVAASIVLLLGFLAVFGRMVAPFDPGQVGVAPPMLPPAPPYWLGTDELGRDLFSRVVSGVRVSLSVGVVSTLVATVVGVVVGAVAGFFGGLVDDVLMRVTELFMVIPRFFLALVIVALFGSSIVNIVLAIAVLAWPIIARIVRSEFLSLKSRQYVDAARVAGAGTAALLFGEILPNALGAVTVTATLQVGQAMLLEAGLSYLGLGDPNALSLGLMLQQSQGIMRTAWWAAAFPGLMIFLAVLSSNLIGDALNDVYNPRSRSR